MPLAKIDVENKHFGRRLRGYDREEVEAFMQEVAESMGELADVRVRQEECIARQEEALNEHRQREAVLRDTLLSTQKMVEEIKTTARKEAELIVEEARMRAREIVQQAHMRLAQIHDDITELKRQRTQFEVKLRSLLEAHLQMLEIERQEQGQFEALESKLTFFKKAT